MHHVLYVTPIQEGSIVYSEETEKKKKTILPTFEVDSSRLAVATDGVALMESTCNPAVRLAITLYVGQSHGLRLEINRCNLFK
jgi:hypothetical protein